ncbi:MAG: peptidase [Cyanobium sp. SAT1300]|nr:peptidase [Cyanobium sp. SAT1300]
MPLDPCPPVEAMLVSQVSLERSPVTSAPGYGSVLATTSLGPPVLQKWCVWLEPADHQPPDRWEERWTMAVQASLSVWEEVLPITRVMSPAQAHIQIFQRRPPRRRIGSQWRASNGRSRLQVVEVQRRGQWRLEPRVDVLVSPELRASVIEATAIHELGHAFGLWGHSPQPNDVMAVHQNQKPVVKLSQRDRVTLNWLYQRATGFGRLIQTNSK